MNRNLGRSKISLVYARALFDAAQEGATIEKINKDAQKIFIFLEHDNDALYKLLLFPVVELEDKRAVLKDVFFKELDLVLFDFLNILVAKNRFNYIGGILEAYSGMVDAHFGIIRGDILISKMPNSEQKGKIVDSIQALIPEKLQVNFTEEPDLVAGFSAKIGSYRLEYSFDSHLKQIEKKLISRG